MELAAAIAYCISAFIKYKTILKKEEIMEKELELCQQSAKTKKPKQ